ncbi:TPA: hypothetical protein DIV48_03285 [Candidatus Kaiserbacteria bacterium]|nr:MAG: hypothetical protein UY93_C0003G0076 [Parcubacteria group bacterium GW2011_GWA1_56_13]KKW46893.1 MAG: hypothetical protein UY97_C0002G0004 [Parcubacteria group bacterium GW2011_GWB1_57_6]HCR52636.1 hypothetical protein [Candidatus Kaiserbacteria bacterium]
MEPFRFHRDSVTAGGFTPLDNGPERAIHIQCPHYLTGFTLVELMVVISIMAVITAIVLTSQSSFNKTLVLANTAYDIALSLRSAETYGIGSRAITGGAVNAGYGIHFERGNTGSYVLFADISPGPAASGCHGLPAGGATAPDAQPGNCVYTSGSDALVRTYMLGNGITIKDFCAYSSGAWSCMRGGLSSLDIVFARPNPDPFMSKDGAYSRPFPVTAACLTVASPGAPDGPFRFISIAQSGAITANAASDPSSCH